MRTDSRSSAWALAAVVAAALGLRLWHVGYGLPDFLEEATPLRLALERVDPATGAIDWNPHAFNDPSLSIYLHLFLQLAMFGVAQLFGAYSNWADWMLRFYVDPAPMVVPARLLGIACDTLAIAGVVRIGMRLAPGTSWLAGGLAALAPALIVTSRSIFCDSLMAAFAVWAVERMLAWKDGGARRDLTLAALFVGLAAGAKYPAAALLAPLAWVLVRERGAAGLRTWVGCAAIAFAVFLATTPFAVLSPREFLRDFSFEGGHAAGGHLGSVGQRAFLFHLGNLATNLGWGGLAVLFASWLDARGDRARVTRLGTLWLALLAFGVPISLARIEAERYLVPVVLFAAPLVAAGAFAMFARATIVGSRAAAIAPMVLPAILLVGVALPAHRAATAGGDTTQRLARRWCEEHVGRDQVLVQEGYSARLPSVLMKADLTAQPVWQHASPKAHAAVDSIPTFHVVAIPLQVAGNVTVPARGPNGALHDVVVLPHASLLNRVYYDPRLYVGADFVMTSSAVRGRIGADPARYPVEHAFYEFLDTHATVVAQFAEAADVTGPEIRVYALGDEFCMAATALGELPRDWWQAAIPAEHRAEAGHVYAASVQTFVSQLANEYVVSGRPAAARPLAEATLAVSPEDVDASAVLAAASSRLGDWQRLGEIAERVLATPQPAAVAAWFEKQRATARAQSGRVELAAQRR